MRNRRHFFSLLTFVVVAFLTVVPRAAYATIVVPNSLAAIEGNSDNTFPFGFEANTAPVFLASQRYQQVYSSSEFGALSGPSVLTQIAFRLDTPSYVVPPSTFDPNGYASPPFTFTVPEVEIRCSPTPN